MPKFFKQNLLTRTEKEEQTFLPNPLETPELPKDEKQAEQREHQTFVSPAPEVYHAESFSSDVPTTSTQPESSHSHSEYHQEDLNPVDHPHSEHHEQPLPVMANPADHPEHHLPHHEQSHYQVQRNYANELDEPNPVKTLLTWTAPARPFRKKDRSFYTAVITMITLISLIALLAGQIMLIGVLLAFLFLIYALNFVPPEDVQYKVSTQGVTIADHFYHWQELDSFWFTEKEKHKLLHILTRVRFPGVLIIVLGEVSEEEVRRIVARYLPYHEIAPKSLMDKWAEGLQKHFPLENPHRVSH